MSKGQIAVMDLMIVVFILAIIIVFFVYQWNLYSTRLNDKAENNDMVLSASKISDVLLEEGKPMNWDNDTAEIIGLAVDDNKISENKLNNFLQMNYTLLKKKLGLRNYDFYFRVNNLDGSNYRSYGEMPRGKIISVKRLALLNGDEKEIEIMLWK